MNEGFNWLRKVLSALNSLAAIHAVRGRIWLVGILILLLFPNAFAETDFSTFWNKFRSAIIAGDKAAVAEMTKFPVSMPYLVKAVKNKRSSCAVIMKFLKARPMPPNVLRVPNRKNNPRGGMRSTALLRKLQTTGKTRRSALCLN